MRTTPSQAVSQLTAVHVQRGLLWEWMSQWQEGKLIKPSWKILWGEASCYSDGILTWSAGPWMWSAFPQCLWFWLGSSGHPAELGCRWPGISCPNRSSSWEKDAKKRTRGGKHQREKGVRQRAGGETSGRKCVRSNKAKYVTSSGTNNSQCIVRDKPGRIPYFRFSLKQYTYWLIG